MALQQRLPTANGDDDSWGEVSASPQVECVNDPIGSPNDDTDFVLSTADGDRMSFEYTAFSITPVSITRVSVFGRCRSGAGTPAVRFYLTIGGTRFFGSNHTLSTSWANFQTDWTTDPSTTAAWTESGVETGIQEFGIESVSGSADGSGCTQIYIEVEFTEAGGGRTTKNTRSFPLGERVGMGFGIGG